MDVSTANIVSPTHSALGILSLLQSTSTRESNSPISSSSELLGTISLTPDVCAILSSDDASSLDSIDNLSSSTLCANNARQYQQYSQEHSQFMISSRADNMQGHSVTNDNNVLKSRAAQPIELDFFSKFSDTCLRQGPTNRISSEQSELYGVKNETLGNYEGLMAATACKAPLMSTRQHKATILASAACGEGQHEKSKSSIDAATSMCKSLIRLSKGPESMQRPQTMSNQISMNVNHINPPSHHLIRQLHIHQEPSHLFTNADLSNVTSSTEDIHQRLQYAANDVPYSALGSIDCVSTQKAVAFLAGPRERIHVLGNPVEHCPRCQQEGRGSTGWRPHRHIGELKIRYICERHFSDLESNHHFDIPLCPVCNQILYLYDFNSMLGVSNARRLHKFVLKCANRHVLPLLDLFCQTKKGGERCNANFKLQWCYGTMVKRCEAQKNRDHDLWWVRYKNEWKQRRTIIRYKKDFLSHLTDVQRSLLLGLGLEGEPPPDPKSVLGSTFDTLLSSVVGSPGGSKIKKRNFERNKQELFTNSLDSFDVGTKHRKCRQSLEQDCLAINSFQTSILKRPANSVRHHRNSQLNVDSQEARTPRDESANDSLRYIMGAVVFPSQNLSNGNQMLVYVNQQQQSATAVPTQQQTALSEAPCMPNPRKILVGADRLIPSPSKYLGSHSIITGTPTPPLPTHGVSPVALSIIGEVVAASVVA